MPFVETAYSRTSRLASNWRACDGATTQMTRTAARTKARITRPLKWPAVLARSCPDYLVSSASANAAYPIEVDFFLADADVEEGKVYLGSDTYTTPNSSKNVAITPPVTLADGDPIVATATDADGNTSEFSDPFAITGIVSVEADPVAIPASFTLEQNYPNPFNPVTTIRFSLAKSTSVKLEIIDRTGRVVATLVDETLPAGAYTTSFDAGGQASGVYFYRLSTDRGFSQTKKLVLVK